MRSLLLAALTIVFCACGGNGGSPATELDGVVSIQQDDTIQPEGGVATWEVRSDTLVAIGHETGACTSDDPPLPASVSASYAPDLITIDVVNGECGRTDVDSFAVGAGFLIELTEAINGRDIEVAVQRR